MARNQVAKKSVLDNGHILFTFSNGTNLEFRPEEVDEAVRTHAMQHGFLQKIGDSYAGAKTVEDAVQSATATVDNLYGGNWNERREGGEGPDAGLLLEAVARVKGKTTDEVKPTLDAMSKEEKAELRKHPAIVKATGEIKTERAERATAPAKAADLLSLF